MRVFEFSTRIVDSLDQTAMYVRDCYAPMYTKLLGLFAVTQDSSERRRYAGAIVTGTSGIGKTFMSCYAVYRLVKEELCTVLYNFRNSKRYVLAPPRSVLARLPQDDPRRAILGFDEFKEAGLLPGESEEDRKASYWWGELNMRVEVGERLYERLKTIKGLWLIVDLHEEKYTDGHPECRVALFLALFARTSSRASQAVAAAAYHSCTCPCGHWTRPRGVYLRCRSSA
jgi:hypothetical protein